MPLPAGAQIDSLGVELGVDRVRSPLPGMKLVPDREQPEVVLAPAERARPMSGRERGHLVEEEQARVAAGRHQRLPAPTTELQPARDPALAVVAPADSPGLVVQAAAVCLDETPGR